MIFRSSLYNQQREKKQSSLRFSDRMPVTYRLVVYFIDFGSQC